jgi:hypothetical protein
MEVQGAFGGFGTEVGGFVANADGHGLLLLRLWGRLRGSEKTLSTAIRPLPRVAGTKSIGPRHYLARRRLSALRQGAAVTTIHNLIQLNSPG